MNRIIAAVKSTVLPSLWPELVRKIDADAAPAEPQHHQIGVVGADDEGYDPLEFAEVDDDDQ